MGGALAAGFIKQGVVAAEQLSVSDPNRAAVDSLRANFLGITACSNAEAVRQGDVVVCAVKPAQMPALLTEIAPCLTAEKLVISVAAGLRLIVLEELIPAGVPVIRAMPNVAALVGEGMSVLSLGSSAGEQAGRLAEELFAAVGRVTILPEKNMDAVTGLSGSGPAYVALIIEALADGGVKMGLPRQVALELAVQTVLGTAMLVRAEEIHPALLKDRVTSPGGTTIAGLHHLEKGGLRGLLIGAVEAAAERSAEL